LTRKKEDSVRALNAKRIGSDHKIPKEEFENKIAQDFMKPWKRKNRADGSV
jgi:hypothetical protein